MFDRDISAQSRVLTGGSEYAFLQAGGVRRGVGAEVIALTFLESAVLSNNHLFPDYLDIGADPDTSPAAGAKVLP